VFYGGLGQVLEVMVVEAGEANEVQVQRHQMHDLGHCFNQTVITEITVARHNEA